MDLMGRGFELRDMLSVWLQHAIPVAREENSFPPSPPFKCFAKNIALTTSYLLTADFKD